MTTIVFTHPWHGSFNKAILDTIIKRLTDEGKEFTTIDLHKDGFNPCFTEQELALYGRGEYLDPLVGKYQNILKSTDEIIFIFPIWWGTMPATLKGFFDKVWLKGFAYDYDENGNMFPLLNIEKSFLFTTSQAPTDLFHSYITGYFDAFFMKSVGIMNTEWLNCDQASYGPHENRAGFLQRVEQII